jgi:hypothetical protein
MGSGKQQSKPATMRNVQITKASIDEQMSNSRFLRYFEFAFVSNDVGTLREKLHANGIFFGKYSKEKTAGIFYKMFFGSKGIHELFNVHVNRGIALDGIPGAEVVEFRFSDVDPHSPKRREFGDPADKAINERVFRFCFEFRDDLIYRIVVPTKYMAGVGTEMKEN